MPGNPEHSFFIQKLRPWERPTNQPIDIFKRHYNESKIDSELNLLDNNISERHHEGKMP